ncbi:MAG: Smr/MutS family protein [Candidatus Thorarchaeota archaeon]
MKADLHGFRLFEAIEEIIDIIEDCLSSRDYSLLIIHGYRRGQVLKNYFRSKKFLEDMASEGIRIKELNYPNPGASMFKII